MLNLILGNKITNKPAIANIAPEAPIAEILGLPKIFSPKP